MIRKIMNKTILSERIYTDNISDDLKIVRTIKRRIRHSLKDNIKNVSYLVDLLKDKKLILIIASENIDDFAKEVYHKEVGKYINWDLICTYKERIMTILGNLLLTSYESMEKAMEEEGKYFISMIATSVEVFLEMTYEYIIYFKKNKDLDLCIEQMKSIRFLIWDYLFNEDEPMTDEREAAYNVVQSLMNVFDSALENEYGFINYIRNEEEKVS